MPRIIHEKERNIDSAAKTTDVRNDLLLSCFFLLLVNLAPRAIQQDARVVTNRLAQSRRDDTPPAVFSAPQCHYASHVCGRVTPQSQKFTCKWHLVVGAGSRKIRFSNDGPKRCPLSHPKDFMPRNRGERTHENSQDIPIALSGTGHEKILCAADPPQTFKRPSTDANIRTPNNEGHVTTNPTRLTAPPAPPASAAASSRSACPCWGRTPSPPHSAPPAPAAP